jgi:1-acyl-sn-glycerol-3-phosphate acyltransferase
MIPTSRAVVKLVLLSLWSALLVPIQCLVLLFHKGHKSYFVPQLWHKGVSFIIGLKTEVTGEKIRADQVIFVSNHLSYLDIFGIGSILRASFIAKEDIARWPVIGFLSTVQQTAFISRSSNHARKVANSLGQMLAAGKSLILFPEGTSTDGRVVLPFKSSLFSLVWTPSETALPVHPFTLTLLTTGGQPVNDSAKLRDMYAWYGDMDFAPHFWEFLKSKGARIRLTFHPVIMPEPGTDRKILAQMAWNRVHTGLNPGS